MNRKSLVPAGIRIPVSSYTDYDIPTPTTHHQHSVVTFFMFVCVTVKPECTVRVCSDSEMQADVHDIDSKTTLHTSNYSATLSLLISSANPGV
jgi:hypothetical protein